MTAAATVLQSPQLVGNITEYQRGIHADMRPLLLAMNPGKNSNRAKIEDECERVNESFASLHVAITAWYNEWGYARLFKLFACQPGTTQRVIAHALWSGNLSVLTLLPVELLRRTVPFYNTDHAALQGDVSVLKYFQDVVGLHVSTPGAMHNAARYGHLEVVRYLCELKNDVYVRPAILAAACHGHLEVLEIFHTHLRRCDLREAFAAAVWRTDLVVAQFILDLGGKPVRDSPNAMDFAAESGNMANLEWLHQRGCACSTTAMNRAASNGRLDVLQWLHANRSEVCTGWAMQEAASNGFLDVVKWLYFNRHKGSTVATLEEMIKRRYWQFVRFVVPYDMDQRDGRKVLEMARWSGAPVDIIAALVGSVAIKSRGPPQKKRCLRAS